MGCRTKLILCVVFFWMLGGAWTSMAVIGSDLNGLEIEGYEKWLTVCPGPYTCLKSNESSGYFLVVHLAGQVADQGGTVFPSDFVLRTETQEGNTLWRECKALGRFDMDVFVAATGVPLMLTQGPVNFSVIFHIPAGQNPVDFIRTGTGASAPVTLDLRVKLAQKGP